ncbi:MAG: CHAP domain-containing protein [Polyangiaceae bacterium]
MALSAIGVFLLTGSSAEAVGFPNSICGKEPLAQVDGIPAYGFCGDFNVWSNDGRTTEKSSGGAGWIQTEGGFGYQCVEFAARYEHFAFGVPMGWHVKDAAELCPKNPPAMTATSNPMHGDLVVFGANAHGIHGSGHVAVVDSVSGDTINVVQQNESPASRGYPHEWAACYLHAAENNDCGKMPDGDFCGDSAHFPHGKKGTIYSCRNHQVATQGYCFHDKCEAGKGTEDKCAPRPKGGRVPI